MDKTFPVTGPINLQVRAAHGRVAVEAEDGLTEARVSITAKKKNSDILDRTTVEMRGSTLMVHAPRQGGIFDLPIFGRRDRDDVHIHVFVPAGTPVKVVTFTAPIVTRGRIGSADLAFGAAEAGLEQVDGDLRVRFGSGTVRAIQVSGSVELRSGSGDAKLGEIGGAVSAGCGSGTLEVRLAHGTVRSRTGSGNAKIGAAHGDVDVVSGSGNVQIGLPEGVVARLDVTSGSGRVETDLPIEDAPRSTTTKPITLRARTGSGSVRLFRAA